MHTAEVEKSHIKIHGGTQVFECLAESETQSGKAAKVCSHAQVRPFDVAGRNSTRMRIPNDGRGDRRGNLGGGIPFWPLATRRSIHLHQLSEVNVGSEVFLDGRNVGFESIGCDLEPAIHSLAGTHG